MIPEDVAKFFLLLEFTTSGPGKLIEVADNYTTTRDKISFRGFEVTESRSMSLSVMLKTRMEVKE